MNQIDNKLNIDKTIINLKSDESSDEESLDFFHIDKNYYKSKEEEKNNFLNAKRKYSDESNNKQNNKNIDKDSFSSDDISSSIKQNEKKKKKKEKYYNFKSVKSKQICQFYINGACKKGDKCPYSHEAEQIHKKELCKFYLSGKCTKGEKCLYSHDLSEIPCKYYHGLGFCDNFQNCPFSHERLDQEGIKEFIINNEDFLKDTKNKYGRTNLDEFYNAYIKEKQGSEEYIMVPEFIKNEDKEKEKVINDMNSKIPLGFVVLSSNNKVLNEFKNLYNSQQINMTNILNNINRNNLFNNMNIINNGNKTLWNIKNSQIIQSNNNLTKTEKVSNSNIKDNNLDKDMLINSNKNNDNMITNNTNNEKQSIKPLLNLNNENKIKDNPDNKFKEDFNINNSNKDDLTTEKKEEKSTEDKQKINQIEINPFLNPMLISSATINNLF